MLFRSNSRHLVLLTDSVDLGADALALPAGHPSLAYIRTRLLDEREELVPVITDCRRPSRFMAEKAVSVDTTAAGGNASLMAGIGAA